MMKTKCKTFSNAMKNAIQVAKNKKSGCEIIIQPAE